MSSSSKLFGRVRSALGWATADRREEAKGKLQELDADAPGTQAGATDERSSEAVAGATVDQAELDVRGDHGDLAPSTEAAARTPQQPPTAG